MNEGKIRLMLYLDIELKKDLEILAKEEGRSMNNYIVMLIKEQLKKKKDESCQ